MSPIPSPQIALAITITLIPCSQWAVAAPRLETLFQQGQPLDGASELPGFSTLDTVRSNGGSSITATPNGSFVTSVRTNSSQGSANGAAGVFYLFGSSDRGATVTAFRREDVIAGIDQQNLGGPAIDHAGEVTYRALTGNNGLAGSGESGLWEDDTPYAYPNDPIPSGPLAGSFYTLLSSPHRTPDGVSSWVASYSATAGGASIGSALMRDTTTNEVILQSGDTIPGLGQLPAQSGAIQMGSRSLAGGSYYAEVDLEPGFTSTDEAPIVNGQALFTTSGGLIREGEPIAAVDGGLAGEEWDIFDRGDVNEAGDWIMSVFTNAPSAVDSLVVVNGEILHRQSDTLDGIPLVGQVQSVGINDLGDIGFVWNETLFINGKAVAGAATIDDLNGDPIPGLGTMVDTDGDGVADAPINGNGFPLGQFEMTNLPAAGGDGLPVVYLGGIVNGGSSLMRFVPAPALAGDYNGDGVVDAADYTVWRDTEGSEILLAADGDQDNVIGAGDYATWTTNFGDALAAAESLPEPATLVLVLASLLTAGSRRHA